MEETKKPFKRLSKSVRPSNYDVTLKPDLKNFTFEGWSTINVEVKRETKKIIMNCVDIKISKATFTSSEQELTPSDIQYSEENETCTLKFAEILKISTGQVKIEFTGELNDKMKGFYRSKYTTPDGEERYCAVTQFAATDARRAFPCWDEPAVKATFEFTMIAPKDRVVLSNMDVKEESDFNDDDSLQKVVFDKTPIMSTYLAAFVVGEFDYIEEKASNGVTIRVYTPLGKSEQGQFALQIAVKTLPYYEEYFNVKYPLTKLDLIAIPDFAAGAMENWGLVTYRETALLIDSKESSAASRQYVALVVGHEIAHQWFGNLTTMEWWTHLWLNEGFASFIEYLCVDHCCPQYNIWSQFITNDFNRALELDALQNSHPIEVEVGHPAEVDEIFDAISYSKGASVIRMLHDFLGPESFKAGLHSYLMENQYKNAKTDDLWFHLAKASNKDVDKIMSSWTKQMGFPVLTLSTEHVANQRILKIAQKRFTADGKSDSNAVWSVPINISTSNNPNQTEHKVLMSDPDMVIFLDHLPEDAWIKLNPGQIGFYRTCYSHEMIQSLIPAIPSLSSVDRLGLENDLFALAVAGVSKTTDFLDLLTGYGNEDNYSVWSDIDKNIGDLSIILQNTDYFDDFKNFVLNLYKPIGQRLGWEAAEDEDHLTSMLRGLIINRLGKYGDEEIQKEAEKRFNDYIEKTRDIDANLRSAVYSINAASGGEEALDKLITLFQNTTHQEEKDRIFRCMGSTKSQALIERVLNFALSDQVRAQDSVFGITSCTGSLLGRQLTWMFVKNNWEELAKRYGGGFLLSRLIMSTTESFATEEEAADVKQFFDEHKVPAGKRTIAQSLENIAININWLQRDGASIHSWLQKQEAN